MLVLEARARADEYFVQRPIVRHHALPSLSKPSSSNALRQGTSLAPPLFFSVRGRRFPHPTPILVSAAPRLEALPITRPVALEYRLEFAPVDLTKPEVLSGLVPGEVRVGNLQAEELRLRSRDIN